MNLSENFIEAAGDYLHFLGKSYPQNPALKLVCDHYRLSGPERSLLFRGVFPAEESVRRQARLAAPEALQGQEVAIDFLNQLYTVTAYLSGVPVYLATDGYLRDAAEFHGAGPPQHLLSRAVSLVCNCLPVLEPSGVVLYIDEQISGAEALAEMTGSRLPQPGIRCRVTISPEADRALAKHTGIICTSDSAVIDRSLCPVFDLARYALTAEFHTDFTDLGSWFANY